MPLSDVRARAVHPRRRGEHRDAHQSVRFEAGSSPQARGTLPFQYDTSLLKRFIPAGAGNTPHIGLQACSHEVHPRRRGEHSRQCSAEMSQNGSSPQARGTRTGQAGRALDQRFIPAGAGNTRPQVLTRHLYAVHPRRRGEHSSRAQTSDSPAGSSPQARGTQPYQIPGRGVARFIPAGAGNTRRQR